MNTFKKLLLVSLMMLISSVFSVVSAVEQDFSQELPYEEGMGTEEIPYVITNARQLAILAYRVNNGETYAGVYFKLGRDIDLNPGVKFNSDFTYTSDGSSEPEQWIPIGVGTGGQRFMGNFDGNGHKISGLFPKVVKGEWYNKFMDYSNDAYYFSGLFGAVEGGSIVNLTIDNSLLLVNGDELKECFGSNAMNIGMFVGRIVDGSVVNCKNYGHILSERTNTTYIGGIVGSLVGNISQCENHGNITNRGVPEWDYYNSNMIGGVFGNGGGDIVEDLLNTGSLRNEQGLSLEFGGKDLCGGIAYYIGSKYTVKNLVNEGEIFNGSGIANSVAADSLVSICNKGTVFNGNGIARSVDAHVISEVWNEGDIRAESAYKSHIAGLVATAYYFRNSGGIHHIENCWNIGNVTNEGYYAAGLFVTLDNESIFDWKSDNDWVIERSFNIGNITSSESGSAYGLGVWGPKKMINCYNSGVLTGKITEALCSTVDELYNCFNYEQKEYRNIVGWEGEYDYADFVFGYPDTFKNIFYLAPESSDVEKSRMGIAMSATDFANGTVLAALRANQEDSPWFQSPSDRYPKLSEVDDTMSGIISPTMGVTGDFGDGRIYDIFGRFVGTDSTTLPTGLYIMNGRKFIVR